MKKEVKYYNIRVANVEATSLNCNSITGDGITGKVSYNPETNTLTLDNAIIEGGIGFFKEVEDITITLVGENTIESIGPVRCTKIIKGPGSLKGVDDIDCYREKNTIIEDCTIDISYNTEEDYDLAIYGDEYNTTLTIKNANISAEGRKIAIGSFKDIELIGCEIVEPVNAQIIDKEVEVGGIKFAGKYICDADSHIAKKVVIKKRNKK